MDRNEFEMLSLIIHTIAGWSSMMWRRKKSPRSHQGDFGSVMSLKLIGMGCDHLFRAQTEST